MFQVKQELEKQDCVGKVMISALAVSFATNQNLNFLSPVRVRTSMVIDVSSVEEALVQLFPVLHKQLCGPPERRQLPNR